MAARRGRVGVALIGADQPSLRRRRNLCKCLGVKISERLASGAPVFSFEFFPPKNEEGVDALFATVSQLKRFRPAYVSVTYGAGGSTRRLTVDLVTRIQRETGIDAMAHLTCVGAPREELTQVLTALRVGGIENVLALRGDPPQGTAVFEAPEGGFEHASELVAFVREEFSELCVAAACYPEVHPEAVTAAADLDHLKRKVDAGVSFLVTQLFFDPNVYLHFVERCRAAGIGVPIVPGIMPITNAEQVKRFIAMIGASIPGDLLMNVERAGADREAVRRVGVEHAVKQCERLLAEGAPGLHFYTLNRSTATTEILSALRGSGGD
ncbi:MAG: methylenetetrahydrofolate reductase [NAD(P)H] [Polyangiaceae bacterium]|nr:methylenetetrahydrofolate reductase [NAD(P)H] [Polyangiaceae bacterium]MCW5792370.1 methylenetetrahydrofolate reductase [NAD(P)H] [Polyangiaceae bacterium]